jgi:predicted enzyme related to lactoylglutathione lyase
VPSFRCGVEGSLWRRAGKSARNALLERADDEGSSGGGSILHGNVRLETEPFGDSYNVFMNGERPAGGVLGIDEEMGPVPPNWSVYFYVDDCDAIHERAVALGGSIHMPPMDYPEVGRGCVLGDPQGGTFAVIKLVSPPD